jgi:4-hydroxybenzoate polyprenyltransferase
VVWHYTLIRRRSARLLPRLPANHWVGFAVFAGTAVDLALR